MGPRGMLRTMRMYSDSQALECSSHHPFDTVAELLRDRRSWHDPPSNLLKGEPRIIDHWPGKDDSLAFTQRSVPISL